MGVISTRVQERVLTGLKYGAQIAPAVVTAAIANAFDAVYERSEVARLDLTAIDEVLGTSEYAIPSLSAAPAGSRIVRILSACRVTYDGATIKSRTYLDDGSFSVDAGIGADGTAPDNSTIVLASDSPATATGSLILRAVASFPTEEYIPPVYSRGFEDAVVSLLLYNFSSESGKPWFDPNRAAAEARAFKGALNRIRAKSVQRGTGRSTACRARVPFI